MSNASDRFRTFDDDSLAELSVLIRHHRQAVLATQHDGGPYTAMTTFVPQPDFRGFLLHLSELSAHKRQLRADPRASLIIFEPDNGRTEIMAHRRLSLTCNAEFLAKSSDEYDQSRASYLARFPSHEMMFGLGDFDLVNLVPTAGLLNAGFGRAYPVTPDILATAAAIDPMS